MATNFLDYFIAPADAAEVPTVSNALTGGDNWLQNLQQSSVYSPASNFSGVPGLPGASGNSNPGSIVNSQQPITNNNPTGANESSSFLTSLWNTLNETSIGDILPGGAGVSLGDTSNTSTNPGQKITLSNGSGTQISDIFLRGTIIILGFIFVAVGLSMFKSNDLNIVSQNSDVLKGFKRTIKGRK